MIDTGRMEIVLALNSGTGTWTEIIVFPKATGGVKGLRKAKEVKSIFVPSFCPMCGMPFHNDGPERYQPSCTGRLAAMEEVGK